MTKEKSDRRYTMKRGMDKFKSIWPDSGDMRPFVDNRYGTERWGLGIDSECSQQNVESF
jgi:hypothetical protein